MDGIEESLSMEEVTRGLSSLVVPSQIPGPVGIPKWQQSIQTLSSSESFGSYEDEVKGKIHNHKTPDSFKNLILKQEITVSLAPILFLINGLPDSGKSKAILKLLEGLNITQPESPQHGLSFFELAAIEVPDGNSDTLEYVQTNSNNCYLYAIQSAIKYRDTRLGRSADDIKYKDDFNSQFQSNDLNNHLLKIFEKLPEKLKEGWEKSIIHGIALINIWDIGLSRTLYHSLPALSGLLFNSYSWLFFDLQRDAPNFDKLTINNENHLMKWRTRIHYFLRAAKLSESHQIRENVCSIFAKDDPTEISAEAISIDEIMSKLKNTAPKIGVMKLVDTSNISKILFEKNDGESTCSSARQLKQAADKIVFEKLANKNKIQVPLSFIFLRSLYYSNNNDDFFYIKKKDMEVLANELGITSEKFKEFCQLFTSLGSIIDVTLIDQNSQYIILKPNLFFKKLHESFDSKNKLLMHENGILTLSDAKKQFGLKHFEAFTEILISFNLAVTIPQVRIETDHHLPLSETNWYIPDMRTASPMKDTKQATNALRMVQGLDAPQGHLQASFVRKFLKLNERSKLNAQVSASNVTTIKVPTSEANSDFVEFDVVYFGYTLEFRVKKVDEKIFKQIIQTCHEIMNEKKNSKTNYNFAVMCSKDPDADLMYELTRDRHLLPDNELCDVCRMNRRHENKYLHMWNQLLKEKGLSVPSDRELNGNKILLDDVYHVAQKMQPPQLSEATIEKFYTKLNLPQEVMASIKAEELESWQLPMTMLIKWNKTQKENKFPKRALARIFVSVAKETDDREERNILEEIIQFIDSEVLQPIDPINNAPKEEPTEEPEEDQFPIEDDDIN